MRGIKGQYFLTFAVVGCVLPYLSPYLVHRGFDEAGVGLILGCGAAAVIVTPVLVTLLADAWWPARRVMAGVYLAAGAALTALLCVERFWLLLICWVGFQLAFCPSFALQDGLNFQHQHRRRAEGLAVVPYHQVRLWGTFGFVLPSLVMYMLLRVGVALPVSLVAGVGFCLAATAWTPWLPPTRAAAHDPRDPTRATRRLPTLQAARAMCEPRLLVFCTAMFLLQMAVAAYYGFFPIYLTDQVHVDQRWLGLIFSLGVVLEIPFMLGFGAIIARLGLRRLLLTGIAVSAIRLGVLAVWPSLATALFMQVCHGPMVLVAHVVPPVYLNSRADERYRHSIQGIYLMVIGGAARVAGMILAGLAARQMGMTSMFAVAAGICALAALLILVAFHDHGRDLDAVHDSSPAQQQPDDPIAAHDRAGKQQ